MTPGPRPNEVEIEMIQRGSRAPPQLPLQAEAQRLRTENGVLLEQLTLRDAALDVTPTFFVIAKLVVHG